MISSRVKDITFTRVRIYTESEWVETIFDGVQFGYSHLKIKVVALEVFPYVYMGKPCICNYNVSTYTHYVMGRA